jgi:hypothetical protein
MLNNYAIIRIRLMAASPATGMPVSVTTAFPVTLTGCACDTLDLACQEILDKSCRINGLKTGYHLDSGTLQDIHRTSPYASAQQVSNAVVMKPAGKHSRLMRRGSLNGG